VEVAFRKTVAHLDELRYASRKVSDLLEEVNEQEWKNNHVAYCNTHCFIIFCSKRYFCLFVVQTVCMYTQPNHYLVL